MTEPTRYVPHLEQGLADTEWLEGLVRQELYNRGLQGYDLAGMAERLDREKGDPAKLWALYEDVLRTGIAPSFAFQEPNDLPSIQGLRPDGPRVLPYDVSDWQLRDRLHGALLGRVIGVVLGRPVEGLGAEQIRARLESTGDYPLSDYFRRYWMEDGRRCENAYTTVRSTREGLGRGRGAEADDDLNYVVLNLRLLEKLGPNFTTADVGYHWLESFPVNWSWGPERTAYINLARFTEHGPRWRDIDPDVLWRVTHYLHESSELIGAQIRADAFGYATPGLPELAAEWAWRDAALTHVKNGIYGEMLFAATISAAFVAGSVREAIEVGLTEIPANCRLVDAVRQTLAWWDESHDWEAVAAHIFENFNVYTPGGTINNACIIANGLLAGDGDFERTMCLTVMQGQDTDCTAATAGSIIGAWLGAINLPTRWTEPLHDTFQTAVVGRQVNSITETADRFLALARGLGKAERRIPFRWDM